MIPSSQSNRAPEKPNANSQPVDTILKEIELLRAEARLNTINEVCFELDHEFRITYANRKAYNNWNRNPDQVIGRNVWEAFPELVNTPVYDTIMKASIEKVQVVREAWCPVISIWMLLNVNPSPSGLLVIYIDVTELYQAREALKKQQEELSKFKALQQKEILNAVLLTQEQERKIFAESLHNGLGQLLYAAKLGLEILNPQDETEEYRKKISRLGKILDQAIDNTRNISLLISPQVLENFGLNVAIESMLNHFRSKNLAINYEFNSNKERLDSNLEIAVFRIVQELLNNIAKHSQANEASILIDIKERSLIIKVEDNGKGFNVNEISTSSGLGLKMVENRVKLLNGLITIDSHQGTCVLIIIKFKNN